jgi:uncharacterized FlaG/YvyC family protein
MSDAVPVSVPASIVTVSQTPIPAPVTATSGNSLPQSGNNVTSVANSTSSSPLRANAQNQSVSAVTQKATATNQSSVPALVQQLNKYLNDSGRANQFRVDPLSRNQTIQEINPSNGEVIGEFAVNEFPELARSLGVSGILVDSHA